MPLHPRSDTSGHKFAPIRGLRGDLGTSAARPAPVFRLTYPAQTNQQTCGVAALAAFSARLHEASNGPFARYCTLPPEALAQTQADLHRLLARTGVPWPRFWGTAPWALARLAERASGVRHVIRLWNEQTASDVDRMNAEGHDVFVYVGRGVIPRHVVLYLGDSEAETADPTRSRIFEPTSGRIFVTTRGTQPGGGQLSLAPWGGWPRPLLAVLPDLATV